MSRLLEESSPKESLPTPPPPENTPAGAQTLVSAQVDPEQATPMIRQYLEVKTQYPGIILFYQMGDFYETFFEDALICARVLDITLTGRDAGALGRIPMAGIPIKAVDSYLPKLLEQRFKVALCEQAELPSEAKGLVKRQVVRVLSNGTITEQAMLRPEENNYLAAVIFPPEPHALGALAVCDVSTGSFLAAELNEAQLLSELDRLKPAEVLVSGKLVRIHPDLKSHSTAQLQANLPANLSAERLPVVLSARPAHTFDATQTQGDLLALLRTKTLESFGLEDAPQALAAAGAIAAYLKETFIEALPVFDSFQVLRTNEAVYMNAATRKNLELLATVKTQQTEGSLYWVLNKTHTSMGARLLRQWLSRPLKNLDEIHARLDAVEALSQAAGVRERLSQLLPKLADLERLSTKLANLTIQPRDLLAMQQSLSVLPQLAPLMSGFKSFYLSRLQAFPPELFKLTASLEQAIDDQAPQTLKEGGFLKAGYHHELDTLRGILGDHKTWLAHYEQQERERTGIKALKLQFNSAFGYFIEVTRANLANVPADYQRKQTLTNAERFVTETLKQHEIQVLDAQSRVLELELSLFAEFRKSLLCYVPLIKDCAQRLAALDVLQSFATVAVTEHYMKPVVDDSLELILQNSRHPVVEKMLPFGCFVPNDCQLSSALEEKWSEKPLENTTRKNPLPQQMLITGPNMAGKSTYMRQVAVIVLMAQVGCFVPADYARIGWVDAIYTRVGAVDDLSSGQSTFMVEMNETAQILHNATRRSLILLDEVGRGTSTFDGVSIAWSVAEYLAQKTGARTLFATHYHELNLLAQTTPKIHNYRVCVSEQNGEIEFLHRVEPGAAQKSYGIQVAKMAGVPRQVIQRAEQLLNSLQKREAARIDFKDRLKDSPATMLASAEEPVPQLSLF